MLIKLFGSCAIIGASLLCGRKISSGLRLRKDSLAAFHSALVMLESEINFSQNSIDNAFENISKSIPLSGFFGCVSENTARLGIRKAWNSALEEYKSRLGLTGSDAEILLSFSAELGITDRENQIKNIRYILSLLGAAEKEAQEKYNTLSGLYRSICTGAGLTAAILLL